MNEYASGKVSKRLRRVAITIAVSGLVTANAVHANPSNNIVLVPPTGLPVLARQSGEAMILNDGLDGRTFLYIEQDAGSQLAILDVTDPGHIKGAGSVQLDVSGPFDFISPVGNQGELVRFRQGDEEALLDLRKKTPSLMAVQGLTLTGPVTRLGNDGFTVSGHAPELQRALDYQMVDTANLRETNQVFDVPQVREELTKADTGTTFLLTEKGLFVSRKFAVSTT
ncbi:MAG: hypothetical protein ACLPWG_16505 [Steroidobacteraceae bacterium]